jgi:hypothetical protein
VGDALGPSASADPLDLENAEALVGYLSHGDPLTVVGAMNALARRDRMRLIPALVLLHDDEAVLVRALAIFGASNREDWLARARKLLGDGREAVRMAAVRALAAHGRLDPKDLSKEASPRMRGYAALRFALENVSVDPVDASAIKTIVGRQSADADEERLGVLSAIADARTNDRLSRLLDGLAALRCAHREWAAELARAATSQRASSLIHVLISGLASRHGRAPLPLAFTLGLSGSAAAGAGFGGLILSTALSLFVVPAFYVVADRVKLASPPPPRRARRRTHGGAEWFGRDRKVTIAGCCTLRRSGRSTSQASRGERRLRQRCAASSPPETPPRRTPPEPSGSS